MQGLTLCQLLQARPAITEDLMDTSCTQDQPSGCSQSKYRVNKSFLKEPESKTVLCGKSSVMLLWCENSQAQYVNEWAWLCVCKIFMETSG